MINPFKFGEVVTDACFTDRRKEMHDIIEYIKAGQNIFIYSYRRLGKTSLIKNILEILTKKKEVIGVYVDIQKVTSEAHFLEVYASSISKALITWKERLEKISSFFRSIVPSFEIDEKGNWKILFNFSKTKENIQRSMEEVFELPVKLAATYRKRVVVIFDEFQEIKGLDGKSFEKKMRSFIQHHNEVCYIFMGSKTHIIMEMFNNPDRAFYKSSAVYPISVIPAEEMVEFVYKRFRDSGKSISKRLARNIIELSRTLPYHIQMLSSNVWLLTEKVVHREIIDRALNEIMHNQNELFFSWYDSCSLRQRSVLYALSQTKEIFSYDSIIKYNLGVSSTVQASLRALKRYDLVHKNKEGYIIADPFFDIWVQRNISV